MRNWAEEEIIDDQGYGVNWGGRDNYVKKRCTGLDVIECSENGPS